MALCLAVCFAYSAAFQAIVLALAKVKPLSLVFVVAATWPYPGPMTAPSEPIAVILASFFSRLSLE